MHSRSNCASAFGKAGEVLHGSPKTHFTLLSAPLKPTTTPHHHITISSHFFALRALSPSPSTTAQTQTSPSQTQKHCSLHASLASMPEWLLVVLLLVVILFLVTVFLALVLLEIAQRLREINKLLEVIARDAEWLVEACMGA